MKKVAIIQSNYIPWKGYFDIINDCDTFIFLDDVQYTKNDWRNRNKIKTVKGASWLTIPIGGNINRLISEVEISNSEWQKKHWNIIEINYKNAKYFEKYRAFFEDIYLNKKWSNLSEMNQYIIKNISSQILGLKKEFLNSTDLVSDGKKQHKVISLLKAVQGDTYISGPAAKNYNEDNLFIEQGIDLIYKDYSNYPLYNQFYPPFDHAVSILDLIFHTGPDASYYIWGWRNLQVL